MTHTQPTVRPPDPDETPLSESEQIVAMRDHPLRSEEPAEQEAA